MSIAFIQTKFGQLTQTIYFDVHMLTHTVHHTKPVLCQSVTELHVCKFLI